MSQKNGPSIPSTFLSPTSLWTGSQGRREKSASRTWYGGGKEREGTNLSCPIFCLCYPTWEPVHRLLSNFEPKLSQKGSEIVPRREMQQCGDFVAEFEIRSLRKQRKPVTSLEPDGQSYAILDKQNRLNCNVPQKTLELVNTNGNRKWRF